MRYAGYVVRMVEMRNAYKILAGRKRPLEKTRCRWEGNIRIYLREMGWEAVEWIHLALDMDQWWAVV